MTRRKRRASWLLADALTILVTKLKAPPGHETPAYIIAELADKGITGLQFDEDDGFKVAKEEEDAMTNGKAAPLRRCAYIDAEGARCIAPIEAVPVLELRASLDTGPAQAILLDFAACETHKTLLTVETLIASDEEWEHITEGFARRGLLLPLRHLTTLRWMPPEATWRGYGV